MKKLLYFEEHRHATWLELFFDLIFVTLIGVITHLMMYTHNGHLKIEYVYRFPLLFIPIWWLWANHTIYSNLYDRDSKEHRVITLIIMLLMIGLSIFIEGDLDKNYIGFLIIYSVIRIIFSFMYLSSQRKHQGDGPHAKMLGIQLFVNSIIGLTGIFFTSELKYLVVYISILLDVVLPTLVGRKMEHVKIHREHLIERIGLLTIILLGESVISLVSSLSEIRWETYNAMAAISGFVLLGGVWWILFDFFHLLVDSKKITKPYIIIIPSLFLHMSLAVLASIIQHAILNDLNIQEFRLIILTCIVGLFASKQIPYFIAVKKIRKCIIQNTICVILLTSISLILPRVELILASVTVAVLIYIFLTFRYMIQFKIAVRQI